jgi:hypothetical protein
MIRGLAIGVASASLLGLSGPPADAGNYQQIAAFAQFSQTALVPGGAFPQALVSYYTPGQAAGTWALYGAAAAGGPANAGLIFRLRPPPAGSTAPWTETVLYNFTGQGDGAEPVDSLAVDSGGALYGTTKDQFFVSSSTAVSYSHTSPGSIFKLTPPAAGQSQWTETTLYSFKNPAEGYYPSAGPILGPQGELYGTVTFTSTGYGAVFELSPPASPSAAWTYRILHQFTGPDGANPEYRLVRNSLGELFGTTSQSGPHLVGTAFRLSPPTRAGAGWTFTTLYSFDGFQPTTQLILDQTGALYGGAYGGETPPAVFKLTPPAVAGSPWTFSVIKSLSGPTPIGLSAFNGALYGVGFQPALGQGDLFQLVPPAAGHTDWTETTLFQFPRAGTGGPGAFTFDEDGNFYGTTTSSFLESNFPALSGVVYKFYPPLSTGPL